MLLQDQVVAKYNPEQNEVEIFGVQGIKPRDSDMICLANMLNELVDEMVRRGYDPKTPAGIDPGIMPPDRRPAADCPAGTGPVS